MDMIKKIFNSEIKEYDDKEMTLTATISTGATDRMRESLDPNGVDLGNYRKNPVVLWAHDYSMPPIGKAVWAKKTDGGIISKVKFYNSDKAIGEFSQEIYKMYKDGFLNAFSVGFIPKETEWAKEEDLKNEKKPRLTYKRWEMLEYSAVPVPANPEALQLAMQKGIIKSPLWKDLLEVKKEEPIIQEFDNTVTKELEQTVVVTVDTSIELLDEINILKSDLDGRDKEVLELKYKLFQLLEVNKKLISEITAKNIVKEIEDVTRGVIRKMQGKLD